MFGNQKFAIFFILSLLSLWPILAQAVLSDPTRPPLFYTGGAGTLELSAILIAPDRRIAVINGQFLREGDRLADIKVISIKPNTVELDGPDGKLTLILVNKTVRQERTKVRW